jgi:hypothetical protein
MDAESLLITVLIFLTVAMLVTYAATRFRVPYTIHAQKRSFLRPLRLSPTMDWTLAAEPRDGLESLSPQEPAAED